MAQDSQVVHTVHVGFTNVYALDSGEGLVLIDTGTNSDELWHLLQRGLQEGGHDVSQVRLVLLTHSHFDHSGLAQRVREASGARVLIHEADVPFLEGGGAHWVKDFQNNERLMKEHGVPQELLDWFDANRRQGGWRRDWRREEPLFERGPEHKLRWEILKPANESQSNPSGPDAFPDEGEHHHAPQHRQGHEEGHPWAGATLVPDATFKDGDEITLGSLSIRVIHTPGHSPGSACFYHEESQTIFTGDHILKRITPNPGIYFLDGKYDNRTRSLPTYVRSLLKVRDIPARRVFPAHEGEIDNLARGVDRILTHHERRAHRALSSVKRGRATAFQVLPYVFPGLRASALNPAMGEAIGHLDLLEDEGMVISERTDGHITYRLTIS